MKTIQEANWQGKRALIRVDYNVPLDAAFRVTDDTRMRASLPTLRHILEGGGSLVLMSHLGRPKEGPADKYSLRHLVAPLSQLLGIPVQFAGDCVGPEAEAAARALQPGQVLLLENLRFHKQEEKGDEAFAQQLARVGDVYVNDAFGTAHRAHASTTIVARFFPEKYAGFLLHSEVENAELLLHNARRPYVAIMGGAKVSDKIAVLENLVSKGGHLIIGGGMTYTFLKAQGLAIGSSLCEEDRLPLALELIEKAKARGVKLLLPTDSVIADKFAADATHQVVPNTAIPDGWMGLDIGPETAARYAQEISGAQTVLWNGPMGVFEMDAFAQGTFAVANALVEATRKGGYTIVGGGDSAAAIAKAGLSDQVSYVSTGGGALLEYLEGKVLPGVQALQ
ncbi:MAG: phosphoglycerate kinase [Bacteroidetes bacterium]|nr:phosphoglycerate kinase [Bacteroidota bacterium]